MNKTNTNYTTPIQKSCHKTYRMLPGKKIPIPNYAQLR